jgi:hypothetical protein
LAGASDNFGGNVAHLSHSLSLEELRRFEPSAAVENGIPTINLDLTSAQPLLPNAPSRPDDADFQTEGMRVLDGVLRHMGEGNWGMRGYSTLELVAHAFHMRELWAMTRTVYQQLKVTTLYSLKPVSRLALGVGSIAPKLFEAPLTGLSSKTDPITGGRRTRHGDLRLRQGPCGERRGPGHEVDRLRHSGAGARPRKDPLYPRSQSLSVMATFSQSATWTWQQIQASLAIK